MQRVFEIDQCATWVDQRYLDIDHLSIVRLSEKVLDMYSFKLYNQKHSLIYSNKLVQINVITN